MPTIEELQLQLIEKDFTIASMKDKTKAFVAKLKDDHNEAMKQLELKLNERFQVEKVEYFKFN